MPAIDLAVRNGLWNALATIMAAASGIIGSVLVVRSLSLEDYGVFSYYLWLAGLLATLGVLAVPQALTKVASELRGRNAATEALALSRWLMLGLFGLNALLGASLAIWGLRTLPPERSYLFIIAVTLIFHAVLQVLTSSLWAHERYRPTAVVSTVATLVQLALISLAYVFSWGIAGYLLAMLSTHVVGAVMISVVLLSSPDHGALKSIPLPKRETVQGYASYLLPISIHVVVDIIVWQRSEVFFLQRLSTFEQVGFYSLAFTVFAMFLGIGWALINGYYPAISREYGAGNGRQINAMIVQGVLLATIYAVPLSFGGLATLQALISLLYGEAMLPAVPVAQILFAGLLPGVIIGIFGIYILALNRTWLVIVQGFIIALLNVALNLLLIPSMGAIGGALANTTAQVGYTLLAYLIVRRLSGVKLPWAVLLLIIAVGALTTYLLPWLVQHWLPGPLGLIMAITLAGACYTLAIWSLGYIRLLRSEPVAAPSFSAQL